MSHDMIRPAWESNIILVQMVATADAVVLFLQFQMQTLFNCKVNQSNAKTKIQPSPKRFKVEGEYSELTSSGKIMSITNIPLNFAGIRVFLQ